MGKTLGKILKIAAFVTLAAVTGGSLGLLGGSFIGATATAGATLFGVSVTALTAGASVAIVLGGVLDPIKITPTSFSSEQGQVLRLRTDPNAPRNIIYGRVATGGVLEYQEALGTENKNLWTVIALAGHECESIDSFYWDGTEITFTSNNAVGKFAGVMSKYEHLGTDDQTVDTNLDSASTKWTSAHRLRAITYIVLKTVFDTVKFPQGFQEIRVFVKGRKIYDPRKDSTNGGSGTHRLDNHSTWEFSDNPCLCIADYLRGIRVANSSTTSYDGTLIAGMEIADGSGETTQEDIAAASRIDWANIATQADICDEQVALKAGGTENRYTANGILNTARAHGPNLNFLASSMGGTVLYQGGKWRVFAAAPIPAIKARTQDDIISDINYRSKKTISDRTNSVRGTIADIAGTYDITPLPAIINNTYKAQDGGIELWLETALPFTTSNTMGQRLSKIILERSRMEKVVSCRMKASALVDTVMDTVLFTYDPFNLTSQKMLVSSWSLRFEQQGNSIGAFIEWEAREENDSIYDWDETVDEQTPVGRSEQTRVDTEDGFQDSALNKGLPPGTVMDQGDGTYRPVPVGLGESAANDGDAVTFSTVWDTQNLPKVEFYAGGLSYDSTGTLTADQTPSFKALGLSASGFTAELKLQGTATTITPRTDTGASETSTNVWELHKANAAEAWDDQYTFQIDVTVTSIVGAFNYLVIGYYTNDGGGYVQRGTRQFINDNPVASSPITYNNQKATFVVDGLGNHAGFEYKVLIESETAPSALSTIDNFDSVTYDEATTGPTTVTATPTGVSAIPYNVKGGTDIV